VQLVNDGVLEPERITRAGGSLHSFVSLTWFLGCRKRGSNPSPSVAGAVVDEMRAGAAALGNSAQNSQSRELQMGANAARLAGTVAPGWNAGSNRMGFLAPDGYGPFFSGLKPVPSAQ
jgi:hypothetical protein